MTMHTLTEDMFAERFPLVTNHLDDGAGWDGCLFETFGAELEFVRQQSPAMVWTLVENDDELSVLSGIHRVNRLGYLVSAVPVPDGDNYMVTIEQTEDEVP